MLNKYYTTSACILLCIVCLQHKSFGDTPSLTSMDKNSPWMVSSTFFVDSSKVGGDGSSWSQAFSSLQDALLSPLLMPGDTILVAKGTYFPDDFTGYANDKEKSFAIPDSTVLLGGFSPTDGIDALNERDYLTYKTILSGEIQQDSDTLNNAYHVVYTDHVSAGTVMDGFTITKGSAIDTLDNSIGGRWFHDGRMTINLTGPTIRNCNFEKNSAILGGAMYNHGEGGANTATLYLNCLFNENHVLDAGGAVLNDGQGPTSLSAPTFINCTFTNNLAQYGGAVSNFADSSEASGAFIDCHFIDNYATLQGGAIYNSGYMGISSPSLSNCTFFNNVSEFGGAMYNSGYMGVSSPSIFKCRFEANYGNFEGGALYNDGYEGLSSPMIDSSIYLKNQAETGGAIFNDGREGISSPHITNTIFERDSAYEGAGAIMNLNNTNGICAPTIANCHFAYNYSTKVGGAITNFLTAGDSIPTITGSTFVTNHAGDKGGAIANFGIVSLIIDSCHFETNFSLNDGGAIYNNADNGVIDVTVTNSAFISNSTNDDGGAIYCRAAAGSCDLQVENSRFIGNSAIEDGGALFSNTNDPSGLQRTVLTNCIWRGNQGDRGGAYYNHTGTSATSLIHITNSSFSGNDAISNGGALCNVISSGGISTPIIANTIIYNNRDNSGMGTSDASIFNTAVTPRITYSLVQGITAADTMGNLNGAIDPLFTIPVDPSTAPTATGNLHIVFGSSIFNVGSNDSIPAGVMKDLDGQDRIVKDVVDLGAYEFNYEFLCGQFANLNIPYMPVLSGTYVATNLVLSEGQVNAASGGIVIFQSESMIGLDPGFEVDGGQVFEAIIEDPCLD